MSVMDVCVRPRFTLLGRSVSAFHVCGVTGLIMAITCGVALAPAHGGSPATVAALSLVGASTFLLLTLLTKAITGEERLVYYHHEVAILAAAGVFLWVVGAPLLVHLDLTLLGVGTFLAFGRMGCFLVGCCHGLPCRFGVRYGRDHGAAGFPRQLVGVRLFPVQVLEAASVFAIVVWGALLIVRGSPPGSVLVSYSIAYGTVRFALELVRGDADRPYWAGCSEAQWTTLALMGLVVGAGLGGAVPFEAWHGVAFAAVATAALTAVLTNDVRHSLFRPPHLNEVAELMDLARARAATNGEVQVGRTSLGMNISASCIGDGACVDHFAFSFAGESVSPTVARRLARMMARLRGSEGPASFESTGRGVYHMRLQREGGASRAV